VTTRLRALLSARMMGLHLLAVVLTTAAILLGLWQWGTWEHQRQDTAGQLADAPAKPLNSVLTSDAPFPSSGVGQPVTFAGRWVPGGSIVVTDRAQGSRRGVWAVTPVAVCDGGPDCAKAPAVLVVRGWTRSVSQVPPPPSGRVRVTGWLQPGEGSDAPDPNPRDNVMPELSVADALQHVNQDLYGGYVIAKVVSTGSTTGAVSTAGTDLEPVTPYSLPKPSAFTGLRNFLYALQWWVFAGFAVLLWLRWCRDEVTRVTGVPSSA
jgi:cytochrome oxidase assembly protein ShyY1